MYQPAPPSTFPFPQNYVMPPTVGAQNQPPPTPPKISRWWAVPVVVGVAALGIGISYAALRTRRWFVMDKIQVQLQRMLEADMDSSEMAESLGALLGNIAATYFIVPFTRLGKIQAAGDQIKEVADSLGLVVPDKVWLMATNKAMEFMQRESMYSSRGFPIIVPMDLG